MSRTVFRLSLIHILSVLITVVLYGRMIEIYLYCSVSPIPFATMTHREWGQIGNNYLKGLFALGFQGFLIMTVSYTHLFRFRVADLRTLAEQRGQRFFQLCYSAHGNSSNHFSDAAFSGQGGYAPQ